MVGPSGTVSSRDGRCVQRGRVCLGISRLLEDPWVALFWSIPRERATAGSNGKMPPGQESARRVRVLVWRDAPCCWIGPRIMKKTWWSPYVLV